MDKIRKWSERAGGLHGSRIFDIVIGMGLAVTLGAFLSGAPYVGTYFEAVPWMIDLSVYNPNLGIYFYMPRGLGDYLSQTKLEMIYVLLSYLFAGAGVVLLLRGSRMVSQKNVTTLSGIILIVISLLMIITLDYYKTVPLQT